MQRIVNPCFGNGGSNPLNLRQGHSIIGNAFDLGSKDCRFKSCCPDFLKAESHNGSVGACKALGKGSIPFSAYRQVAERLIAVVLKTIIHSIGGSNPPLSKRFLSSIGRAIVL